MSVESSVNIREFIASEKECGYIQEHLSLFRYFVIERCTVKFYEALLERGWRRFGHYFFVPICKDCNKCLTIRVRADEFIFTRSFKRVLKKNRNTTIEIKRPELTDRHIELYNRYHDYMHKKKGWPKSHIDSHLFSDMYCKGYFEFGFELNFIIDDKIVAIGYSDILSDSISLIYFFYDPDYVDYSLGVHSVLTHILIAKNLNKSYIYPGYWIENHKSMGYKERYKPFDVLVNRPDIDENTVWRSYEESF